MLSQEETNRVRYHLGYPMVTPAAALTFNMPFTLPGSFLHEFGAKNLAGAFAEKIVRDLIQRMDIIDEKLLEATERMAVKKVDEIEMNPDEYDALLRAYVDQGYKLANALGGYPNPFAERYKNSGPGGGWSQTFDV